MRRSIVDLDSTYYRQLEIKMEGGRGNRKNAAVKLSETEIVIKKPIEVR